MTAISDTVWRKGWLREAAATQAASADLAAFISMLENCGLTECGEFVRRVAIQRGARKTVAGLASVLAAALRERRR